MIKIAICLFAVLFTTMLQAQNPLSESQKIVQQTVINFFDGISNRDSISIKNYSTPDILLFENGMVWNADTLFLKAITLNTATDFKRVNTFDFINTVVNENFAWTTYNLTSEITRNSKKGFIQWMETVVLIKKKKMWKIKVLHSTLIKRH